MSAAVVGKREWRSGADYWSRIDGGREFIKPATLKLGRCGGARHSGGSTLGPGGAQAPKLWLGPRI